MEKKGALAALATTLALVNTFEDNPKYTSTGAKDCYQGSTLNKKQSNKRKAKNKSQKQSRKQNRRK
jgi:hypothetical protein